MKEMEPPISLDLGLAIFVWDSENVFSGKLKILVENIEIKVIFSGVKKKLLVDNYLRGFSE